MYEIIRNYALLAVVVAIAITAIVYHRQILSADGFLGARLLLNQGSAATSTSLLDAVSAAATANATSGSGKWLDVRVYDGEILVTQNLGAVTGTIAGKLQSASDANGTGAADITGAAFPTNTANSTSKVVVDPKAVPGGFLGYVGTIVTGPSLVSVVASGKKHTV